MAFQRGAQGAQMQVAVDPLRNCVPASTIPAAHQRSAIFPSCQRFTVVVRAMDIIDSTALATV